MGDLSFTRPGIREYVDLHECGQGFPLHPDISTSTNGRTGVQVEPPLQWCVDAYSGQLSASQQHFRTSIGGTNRGPQNGATRTQHFAKAANAKDAVPNLAGETSAKASPLCSRVRCLILEFEGQTKTKLGTTRVVAFVGHVGGRIR